MAVEKLKEYAGVMVVAVMLVTTLAAAGQWAIHAQVRPEINRLDGRVDNYENLYEEIIGRLDRMERRMDRTSRNAVHTKDRMRAQVPGAAAR